MKEYDKLILNQLLNSYESSVLFLGNNKRTAYVEMRFTSQSLPEYFDQSSTEYEVIHIQLQILEKEQLIRIIWRDNKKGHIVSKVRLNLEALDKCYKYVNRMPKTEAMIKTATYLEDMAAKTPSVVCHNFAKYLLDRMKNNKSVQEFINIHHLDTTKQLMNAIEAVEFNTTPMYLREFSIENFHDSKVFEKILKKTHKVFISFSENVNNNENEWLAEHNIYQTPNFVYVKGSVAISIQGNILDLSSLRQGLGLSGNDIETIQFMTTKKKLHCIGRQIPPVKKVITIENLTTYFRWNESDSIIVYLGGYHNHIRRQLLNKIHKAFPDAEYLHFGDIDAGGFDIYRDLCCKTGIPFTTYFMDLQTLQKYEEYCRPLTKHDRDRLQIMKSWPNLETTIEYMLEHNIKLEQECIYMPS